MARNEKTSTRVGKIASRAISGKKLTLKEQKSLGASALTQIDKTAKPLKGWAVKLLSGRLLPEFYTDGEKRRYSDRPLFESPGAKFVRVVMSEVTK